MTAPEKSESVIVLLTEPSTTAGVVDWLDERMRGPIGHVWVVAVGSDSPGATNYVSPAWRSTIEAALADHELDWTWVDAGSYGATTVLDLAEQVAASLIVVGTRARSATRKLVLGSHARQVIADATCPVVTVKS